jgi:hypothetical protein
LLHDPGYMALARRRRELVGKKGSESALTAVEKEMKKRAFVR